MVSFFCLVLFFCVCLLFLFVCFCLFGLQLWHMEVPRLGVESELPWPVHTTVTATRDPCHVCNLYHNSQQCWISSPLMEAKDQTRILMDTGQVHLHWAQKGTPKIFFFFNALTCSIWKFPRLGVKLKPQLPAYTTATAMRDPSCIYDLHCSL